MASNTNRRKSCKVLLAPQAAGTVGRQAATFGSERRDHRAPLAAVLRFYPSSTGWITVKVGGATRWFPGDTPIVLVFMLAAGYSVTNPQESFRAP
jgi:hypothetical protein